MPSLEPLQIAVLASLVVAAWAFGFFGSTYEGKWRRRYRDEREFYAQYRNQTDQLNLEKTRRIAALEGEISVLRQELAAKQIAPEPVAAGPEPTPPVVVADIEPAPPVAPEMAADDAAEQPLAEPAAAVEAADVAEPTDSAESESTVVSDAADPAPAAVETETAEADAEIVPQVETPAVAADSPEPAIDASEGHHPVADTTDPVPAPAAHELTKVRGIDSDLAARLHAMGVRGVEDIERLSAEDEKAVEIQLGLSPGHIASEQWRLQAALLGSGDEGSPLGEAAPVPAPNSSVEREHAPA